MIYIQSLAITSYPDKTIQYVGNNLDYTGLVIKALYSNGAETDVTALCTLSPPEGTEITQAGTITVTASYLNKTCDITITAEEIVLESIYPESYPTEGIQYVGNNLDYTGLVIKALYSNGAETDVTALCTLSPPEGTEITSEPGLLTVTVDFVDENDSATTEFDIVIAVPERVPTNLHVTSYPALTQYVGDNVDYSGLVIMLDYSDNTSEDVTAECRILPAEGELINPLPEEYGGHMNIVAEARYGAFTVQWDMGYEGIIASRNWWTLYANGLLHIYCVGNMPDYYATFSGETNAPWDKYYNSIQSVLISDKVTNIGKNAFAGYSNLTNVEIPDSVTSIGELAFSGTGLTSVTIPDSVTTIDSHAFNSCKRLKSVTIGRGITKLKGYFEFAYCTNLTSVTIPDSVTYINAASFEGCYRLVDVYYSGTESQWNAIKIQDIGRTWIADTTIHYNSTGPT